MSIKPANQVWPEGVDKIILGEVDSTMAEAARRAPSLDRPTWILAKHQTASYGRQGRAWKNPEGNFAATLVMKPEGAVQDAALRSFVVANALYEALALYVDRSKLALKWPNDVLLSGCKVAGILLESSGSGRGVDRLAIGVGVNLAHAPEGVTDAAFAPVALSAHVAPPAPEEFLTALAASFADEEAVFQRLGFSVTRDNWLGRAARLGEVITARTTREEVSGTFDGIDAEGNLILRTAKGARRIAAADIYF